MTEKISVGVPTSLIQNQIYALPTSRCSIFCDTGGVTLFQSNTVDFTASVALVLVDGQGDATGAFIRCTSAGPVLVTVKKN